MGIKLFNGLINVGGILTETYYRKTNATAEAKTGLGLDPAKEYNASIGIASVDEYVVATKSNVAANTIANLTPVPFDQTLEIVSVYTKNMSTDRFDLVVYDNANSVVYKHTINRNLPFYSISGIILFPGGKIEAYATDALAGITVVLKPCSILQGMPVVPSQAAL